MDNIKVFVATFCLGMMVITLFILVSGIQSLNRIQKTLAETNVTLNQK
jgi:hypothetical protein